MDTWIIITLLILYFVLRRQRLYVCRTLLRIPQPKVGRTEALEIAIDYATQFQWRIHAPRAYEELKAWRVILNSYVGKPLWWLRVDDEKLSEKLGGSSSLVFPVCNDHRGWCPDQHFRTDTQTGEVIETGCPPY